MENRQQALYWTELVQLKVDCAYIRLYRDRLATTQTRFAIARAILSSGALAAWTQVKSYPMIWGGIIAGVQVAEALQNAIGYAARLRGATALSFTLESLFIDCQMEWEDIFGGRIEEAGISKRRHRLMTLRLDADRKHLPSPLPLRPSLMRLAEAEASAYFDATLVHEAP